MSCLVLFQTFSKGYRLVVFRTEKSSPINKITITPNHPNFQIRRSGQPMILNLKHWLPVPYYCIWATKEKREMTQSPTKPSREQKSASCQNKEYVRGDIKKIYMIGATT